MFDLLRNLSADGWFVSIESPSKGSHQPVAERFDQWWVNVEKIEQPGPSSGCIKHEDLEQALIEAMDAVGLDYHDFKGKAEK
jgi:hypothetical protein